MKTNIIRRVALISFAGLVAFSGPGLAQNRALQQRLENASKIDCRFEAMATASWEDGVPAVNTAAADFEASFFDINVDEGSAEADSSYGASYIVVRYSFGYLHLMQMINSGPLYVTTILAQETSGGRMMAIHNRLEYSPTVLPGFTSRPEIYVGDCEVS